MSDQNKGPCFGVPLPEYLGFPGGMQKPVPRRAELERVMASGGVATAKAFEAASIQVIGLQECRIPQAQLVKAGHFTTCYSAADKGSKGCRFWISAKIGYTQAHCRFASRPLQAFPYRPFSGHCPGRYGHAWTCRRVLGPRTMVERLTSISQGSAALTRRPFLC